MQTLELTEDLQRKPFAKSALSKWTVTLFTAWRPRDSHAIFLAQQRLLAALTLGEALTRGTELYNVCKI